jgi:hypothetical protein
LLLQHEVSSQGTQTEPIFDEKPVFSDDGAQTDLSGVVISPPQVRCANMDTQTDLKGVKNFSTQTSGTDDRLQNGTTQTDLEPEQKVEVDNKVKSVQNTESQTASSWQTQDKQTETTNIAQVSVFTDIEGLISSQGQSL